MIALFNHPNAFQWPIIYPIEAIKALDRRDDNTVRFDVASNEKTEIKAWRE